MVLRGVQGELDGYGASFPFAYSSLQLGFYRAIEFAEYQEATIVVIGEAVSDFCVYLALSRMRKKVAWLPSTWIENSEPPPSRYGDSMFATFGRSLDRMIGWRQQDGHAYLLSTSVSDEDVEKVRQTLQNFFSLSNVAEELLGGLAPDGTKLPDFTLVKSLEHSLRFPTRMFERDNVDRVSSKHTIGGEVAGYFDPPRPKHFNPINVEGHHWVSEFSVREQHFPRNPRLGTQIVRDPLLFESHARVGRDSVAFVDARTGYITKDIDSWIRKPSIYLPSAFEIFQTLLAKNNYQVEISDKGRFSLNTIVKFGGLATLANFFLTNKRGVFDRYSIDKQGPTNLGNGSETSGLFLSSDKRRYLDFGAFKDILGNEISASTLIYDLIGKGILHRGLILKCSQCLGTDWYEITEVSNEFRCKRCGISQTYGLVNTLHKAEPPWYYKLDEIVFQAIKHNFEAPLLTLYRLSEGTKTFDFAPELLLRDGNTGKQVCELDICCIVDGKLTIGEAKVSDRLAASNTEENQIITNYLELSEKLGAQQIVFATSADKWRDRTFSQIRTRFENSLTKVLFFTRSELNK